MKLNVDCMRDILLHIEKSEYQQVVQLEHLHQMLSYEPDIIDYAVLKLNEANFIDAPVASYIGGGVSILHINDITYNGHQFLESIRAESVWEPTKKIASKIGSFTISGISQVATGVITQLIKTELGLP